MSAPKPRRRGQGKRSPLGSAKRLLSQLERLQRRGHDLWSSAGYDSAATDAGWELSRAAHSVEKYIANLKQRRQRAGAGS